MTTEIVTIDEARAHMSKEGIGHDDQIQRVIDAVNVYLEEKCGRLFGPADGVTREAEVGCDGTVYLVDLVSATEVRIDYLDDLTFGKVVDPAAYRLYPRTESDGTPALRYQSMRPVTRHADARYFVPGRLLEIDGDWGYYTSGDLPPEGVVTAGLLFVARVYKRREIPLNVSSMPAWGFRRMFDKDTEAQMLLAPFIHERKRRSFQ